LIEVFLDSVVFLLLLFLLIFGFIFVYCFYGFFVVSGLLMMKMIEFLYEDWKKKKWIFILWRWWRL